EGAEKRRGGVGGISLCAMPGSSLPSSPQVVAFWAYLGILNRTRSTIIVILMGYTLSVAVWSGMAAVSRGRVLSNFWEDFGSLAISISQLCGCPLFINTLVTLGYERRASFK
ncbi:unnamed protein product, partial [Chrysoparadoxa australica]